MSSEDFDVVFSNSALHWVKDHENLLRRILRALKPGGFARFNFPADDNCATFNRTVQQVMAQPSYAPGFRAFEWPWYMPTPDDYLPAARQPAPLPRTPGLWRRCRPVLPRRGDHDPLD
jgi:trans-aconitate methyltransferase